MAALVLHWPDGSQTFGENPHDALVRLGRRQWTPTEDADEMKAVLSDRAWAWSGVAVDPNLPDYEFLVALEAADLFDIEEKE